MSRRGVYGTGTGIGRHMITEHNWHLTVIEWMLQQQAFQVGRNFQPLSQEVQEALRNKVKEVAGDGRHELFKTTKDFDGPHHRKQHGFKV